MVVLTEVSLACDEHFIYDIPGYNSFHVFRAPRGGYVGGGLLIYVKDVLRTIVNSENTGIFDTHEGLCVEINIANKGKVFVHGVYRPPSCSRTMFIKYLDDTLLPRFASKKCIISGDFNLDLSKLEIDTNRRFRETVLSFNYAICIDRYTRYCPISGNLNACLDNVFSNFTPEFHSYVIGPPLSDHIPVLVTVKFEKPSVKRMIKFRDFSWKNKSRFLDNIDTECLEFTLDPENDVDINVHRLFEWSRVLADKYFPVKVKYVGENRYQCPWMSRDLVALVRKKHRWFNLLKAKLIKYSSFRNYCTDLTQLLKVSETIYYRRRLNSASDSRQKWKTINSFLGRNTKGTSEEFTIDGETVTSSDAIAEEFNQHFGQISHTVRSGISPIANFDGLSHIPINDRSHFFNPCDVNEVEKYICALKGSNREGDIGTKILKLAPSNFSNYIAILFNQSVLLGVYPGALKNSVIVPVHKRGDPAIVSNYRPISLLSNVNKIFESMMLCRLQSFLSSCGLLSGEQHGFKAGFGTETALLRFVSLVLPAFDLPGVYSIAVYLDFQAAFLCIDHEILFKKLARYGIRGHSLEFIKSYMRDRPQRVKFGDVFSDETIVNSGIGQGSCLGPNIYSLYTNDLPLFLNEVDCTMYADDTCLVLVGSDLTVLEHQMNGALDRLHKWCRYNKLSLSAVKTRATLFSNKRDLICPELMINNYLVEYATIFKYLGLFVDSHLKYHEHVKQLTNKLSFQAYVSSRLGYKLDLSAAKSLYYAFTYSSIMYSIAVFGGVFVSTNCGARLIRKHRRIILNLFRPHFRGHSFNSILRLVGLLKVEDAYRLRVACIMYEFVRNNKYQFLKDLLPLNIPNQTHNTRNCNKFELPFPRVENIRINFKYQFLNVWNCVPEVIKLKSSYMLFKREFRKYLLGRYDEEQ